MMQKQSKLLHSTCLKYRKDKNKNSLFNTLQYWISKPTSPASYYGWFEKLYRIYQKL